MVVAGGSPADDPGAGTFSFPGLGDDPEPITGRRARRPAAPRRHRRPALRPRRRGRVAERTGTLADATNLQYEVWANAQRPGRPAAQLAARRHLGAAYRDGRRRTSDQLSRGAPTLALWFYLFAGGLALLLAVGVVLLGAYVGAVRRIYEYAALKVAGVRPKLLRRAVLREYRSTLGVALVVGVAAGLAGAVLMLPGIPLVTVGRAGRRRAVRRPDARAAGRARGGRVVAMAIVVSLALRLLRRATPERLREGTR